MNLLPEETPNQASGANSAPINLLPEETPAHTQQQPLFGINDQQKFGSNIIEQMINAAGGGESGFNLLSKGASLAARPIKAAFNSLAPYEQKAESAIQDYLQTKNSSPEKPSVVPPGQILQGAPNSALEEIEDKLGRNLNIGAAHNTRTAASLKNRISDINNYWSQGFKDLNKKLIDTNYQMPNLGDEFSVSPRSPADVIQNMQQQGQRIRLQDIPDIIKSQGEIATPDFKELMSKAPTAADTSASDFLAKYRSFRDKLYDMSQLTKSGNIDAIYRKQLFADINKGNQVKSIMEDVLQKGLGEHAPEFSRLNQGYSSQVFPLRNNAVARKIMAGKNLSKDMISELSGEQSGQPLLRELVKQDPESLNNVLGQSYKKNPNSLMNPDESTLEYLNEKPDIQSLLEQKRNAHELQQNKYMQDLQDYASRKDISLEKKIKAQDALKEARQNQTFNRKYLGLIGAGAVGVPMIGKYVAKLINRNMSESPTSGETEGAP